jgi:hypothetical protein
MSNYEECTHCHFRLPDGHVGSCPKCGETGKRVYRLLAGNGVRLSASLAWETQHKFLEQNRAIHAVVILLTIIGPILGYLLQPLIGFSISLVLSVANYFLTPYAVMRVIEKVRGQSQ